MADCSGFLIAALRRVAGGGDIGPEELDATISRSEARALRGAEMDAYVHLAQWADDEDIRASDAEGRYAEFKRDQMQRTLTLLMAGRS